MLSLWQPDGQGLSEEAKEIIAENNQTVHLRLSVAATTAASNYPKTACDQGLGEWWSGVIDEVTCVDCIEWVVLQ